MPIEAVTYYRAVCDACGENITERGEFSAWSDHGAAADDVHCHEGRVVLDVVVCRKCLNEFCTQASEKVVDGLDEDESTALDALIDWVADQAWGEEARP